jgi:hypothetical protein
VAVSFIFGRLRSDYAKFVLRGRVPTVFFSDSTGGCHYHTAGDTFDVVDTRKQATQSRIAFRVTAALAETNAPPPFRDPNPALATYADAVTVNHVLTLSQPDRGLCSPADQAALLQIQQGLAAVVQAGPQAFGPQQVGIVLNAAVVGIDALTRTPCQRY